MGPYLIIIIIGFEDQDRDQDRSFLFKRSKDRSPKNSIFFTTLAEVLVNYLSRMRDRIAGQGETNLLSFSLSQSICGKSVKEKSILRAFTRRVLF